MPDEQQKESEAEPARVKFTARLSLIAYDALVEFKRRHRRKTGRDLPLWKILDAAILAYARKQGIRVGE